MSDDFDLERIRKAAEMLGEHYDTVHIFVTRNVGEKDGNTLHASAGTGNWYARYGQIREWLIRQDESTRFHQRKSLEEE